MSEYTKGPWFTSNYSNRVIQAAIDGELETVCELPEWLDEFQAERNANAHLIAAAPLMHLLLAMRANSGDNIACELIEAIKNGDNEKMRDLWERIQASS